MDYKKKDYQQFMHLYSQQSWLVKKEPNIEELISTCETGVQKGLIFSLLERFHYLKEDALNMFLNEIANYIIDCGFDINKTQVVACTFDEEADSGQKVLDMLKAPLYEKGWRNIKTVNNVGKVIKFVQKGKNQIVLVDEFLGTGKTLKSRISWLNKNNKEAIDIRCCSIAGMKTAITSLQATGIEIFCPLQLDKGISEFYKGDELNQAGKNMLFLESKLAPKINGKELTEYSLGYGKAEALYSMYNGNTPNSVFPVFWWIKDFRGKERKTILTRCEKGF